MYRKPLNNPRAGAFANGPHALSAESFAFILAQKAKGAPLTAVARMVGRNPADVKPIYDAAPLVAVPRGQGPRPLTPPAPQPKERSARQKPIPPRALTLIAPILQAHAVSWAELSGPSKARALSLPRQAAYAALREAGFGLATIGAYFGGRDHTSVLQGIRAHQARTTPEADAAPAPQAVAA